jgi:SanA protein
VTRSISAYAFDSSLSKTIIAKTEDEVNGMRKYLQDKGVPREDIFIDHANFDTYDSLYRARDVFLVKRSILFSQESHVIRALYIAQRLGLDTTGASIDLHNYSGMRYYRLREIGARFKAFAQADIVKPRP